MLVRTGLSLLAVGAIAATAIAGTSLTGGSAPADPVQSDAQSGAADALDLRPRIAQADTAPTPTLIQTVPATSAPQPSQSHSPSPVVAQPADAAGGEAPAPASEAQPEVDESALRYFARQGDLDRVEAEIRRLKTLYPNWQPPVDLLDPRAAGGSQRNELQPIWDLYGAGRYSEARQALAKLQASRQNWKPPADLVAALDQGEARQRLVNASDNKQWNSVLEIATQNPSLLVCSNVDILWRVAHAFLETGQGSRTRDVYAYILQNCTNPQERAATMQKAVADLPPDEASALMRYARTSPDGRSEFATSKLSLLRAQIGLASKDPSVAVTPDDLATLATAAKAAKTPDDPILLGFYYYSHKDPAQAIEWFKTALDRKGGTKAAEGYVLALRAAGNDLAAVPAAYEWRTAGTTNMALYLSVVGGLISAPKAPGIDQTVVSQYAPVVLQTKSAFGALSLGWYAANHAQPAAAAEWFQTSLDYEPSEAAAYGLGLAMRALKNEAGLQAVLARWTPNFPRLPQLLHGQTGSMSAAAGLATPGSVAAATPPAPPTVPAAMPAASSTDLTAVPAAAGAPAARAVRASTGSGGGGGGGGTAPAGCANDINVSGLSPNAALSRGWCLMDRHRPMEAVKAFDVAIAKTAPKSKTASEAAYGKSLAYLRVGLTDQAAVAAAEAPQTETRKIDLAVQLLTQRALAAYASGRYVETILAIDQRSQIAPETRDLMLMRGWSYYNLNDYITAKRIFTAVDQATSTADSRKALAAVREAMAPRTMRN